MKYLIMTSQAAMPRFYGSSRYVRIALVELDDSGVEPTMISERARGIKRIISVHERCYRGDRYPAGACKASKAYRELKELEAKLLAV